MVGVLQGVSIGVLTVGAIAAINRSWKWLNAPVKELPFSQFRFDNSLRWNHSPTRIQYAWRVYLARVRWGPTKRYLRPRHPGAKR